MTTIHTKKIMTYLSVQRVLDTQAQEEGYDNCPDDILKTILDYVDRIELYKTCFYTVTLGYQLRNRFRPIYAANELEYLTDGISYGSYSENRKKRLIEGYTNNNWTPWIDTSTSLDYCSCCNKFYLNGIKNHFTRDIHKMNFHKTGDRLLTPDFIKQLQKRRKGSYDDYQREFEFRSIKNVRYRDGWATYKIPKPIKKKTKKEKQEENDKYVKEMMGKLKL